LPSHLSAMKDLKFKEIIATFLVLLFSYTAAGKLLEHARFLFQLRLSPLPQMVMFAEFLSWSVPVLEAAIGVMLTIGIITGRFLQPGLWISLVLMAAFEIYITAMFFSGKDLPCACGGIISLMSWRGHMIFNGLTIILIVVALIDFSTVRSKATGKKYLRV
jgi:putative oxidoreductase